MVLIENFYISSEHLRSPKLDIGFKLSITCIILSLSTSGLNNYLFGYELFSSVSTIFIFFIPIIQISTGSLRFPRILILMYIYIIIHTFIFNGLNIPFLSSFKQFIGLLLFSSSLFCFVSTYRNNIVNIVRIYYKYVFIIACLGILQLIVFVLLKVSIIPQFIISGSVSSYSLSTFSPEILGFLPRAVGISSEPASYAILILPGVFISFLVLIGRGHEFGIYNKSVAFIILLGFILSFSLVGYVGLFLCLVTILFRERKKYLMKFSLISGFVGALFFISQTSVGSKATSFLAVQQDISGYDYTASDLSAFALVSNLLVAGDALKNSYYLGTGLNTHKNSYDSFIYKQFTTKQVIFELNREDAGSLFIRLISEFGIPGILIFLIFLLRFKIKRNAGSSLIKTVNNMSLVVIISYSIRNGGYLNVELLLFMALYYYTFVLHRKPLFI